MAPRNDGREMSVGRDFGSADWRGYAGEFGCYGFTASTAPASASLMAEVGCCSLVNA